MKNSTIKVLSFVLAVVMTVGTLCVVPFSAEFTPVTTAAPVADTAANDCAHANVEKTVVAPTCYKYGYTVNTCKDCGEKWTSDTTEKLGHDWKYVGEVAATCSTKGHEAGYQCTVCGEWQNEEGEIPADESLHTWKYYLKPSDDCTEAKYTYSRECTTCGKVEKVADLDKQEDHNFEVVIISEPTCTATGSAKLVCTNDGCNFEITGFEIAKVAHDFELINDTASINAKATCFENGYSYNVCKNCQKLEACENMPNTYHLFGKTSKLGYNFAEDSTMEKWYASIPCGKTDSVKCTKCNKTYEYTAQHNYVASGIYAYFDVEDETWVRSDEAASAKEFIEEYAKNSCVADLVEIYKCVNLLNGETLCAENDCEKFDHVVLKAVDHLYEGSYTFYWCNKITTDFSAQTQTGTICHSSKCKDNDTVKYDSDKDGVLEDWYVCTEDPSKIDADSDNWVVGAEYIVSTLTSEEVKYAKEFAYKADAQVEKVSHDKLNEDDEETRGVIRTTCLICEQAIKVADEHKESEYICTSCENNKAYNIDGTTYYACTDCTHERRYACVDEYQDGNCGFIRSEIPAKAEHSYSKTVLQSEKTCLEASYYYKKCINANCEATKLVDKDGNDTGDEKIWVTNQNDLADHEFQVCEELSYPATCTENGNEVYECIWCGNTKLKEAKLLPIQSGKHARFDLIVVVDNVEEDGLAAPHYYKYNDNGELVEVQPDDVGNNYEFVTARDPKEDTAYPHYVKGTCVVPYKFEVKCKVCRTSLGYYDANVINDGALELAYSPNHNTVEVDAVAPTCTATGNLAYTYCKDCDKILSIGGTDCLEKGWTKTENIDRTYIAIAMDTGLYEVEALSKFLFSKSEWKNVKMDDSNIKFEELKFADGTLMCYKIDITGGNGHFFDKNDPECFVAAIAPTCFASGNLERYGCKYCNVTLEGKTGATVDTLKHDYITIKADADAEIKTDDFWGIPADDFNKYFKNNAKNVVDHGDNFDFELEYVAATCTEEGYYIGKFCKNCMETAGSEYFDWGENLYAGYRIRTRDHNPTTVNFPTQVSYCTDYRVSCNYCFNCKTALEVTSYEAAPKADHTYLEITQKMIDDEKDNEYKTYYEYGVIKADDPNTVTFYPSDVVAEFYVACEDTLIVSRKCVNKHLDGYDCCKYETVEVIEPLGHYIVLQNGDKEFLDLTCANYIKSAGQKCACCNKVVANEVKVEKDEEHDGAEYENYYIEGVLNNDGALKRVHTEVEHNACDAVAQLNVCADCGLVRWLEEAGHVFYVDDDGSYIKKRTFFDSETDEYDDFVFTELVVPTYAKSSVGKLTCLDCGEVIEVEVKKIKPTIRIKLDRDDVYLPGDTMTFTVSVSSNGFEFSEFNVRFADLPDVFTLGDAKILADFTAGEQVSAYVTGDKVSIVAPAVLNKNVVISGEEVDLFSVEIKISETSNNIDDSMKVYVDAKKWVDNEQKSAYDSSYAYLSYDVKCVADSKEDADYILKLIYDAEYDRFADVNRDGVVDLDDYVAVLEFNYSEQTIADYFKLNGFSIDEAIENFDYSHVNLDGMTFDPTTGSLNNVYGSENDIALAKDRIRDYVEKNAYWEFIGYSSVNNFIRSIVEPC